MQFIDIETIHNERCDSQCSQAASFIAKPLFALSALNLLNTSNLKLSSGPTKILRLVRNSFPELAMYKFSV